jgi:hypothetical protein
MAKEKRKRIGIFFGGGVSQRPKQPLQLKRTFREAGLLKTKTNPKVAVYGAEHTSLDSVSLPRKWNPLRRY